MLLIARRLGVCIRELAQEASVIERSTQANVTDLERAGYLTRAKQGRRNVYTVNRARPFRHPAESGHSVGELLQIFAPAP
ncbi:MAG: MarR family transcriptional regulator [Actinomycetota bacterium]|nr:MarR family transcriptional regulator [Actinomycetota bacterium]